MAQDPDPATDRKLDRRSHDDLDDRMARLRERLDGDRERREVAARPTRSQKERGAMAQALRLSSEFIAAVVVGTAIGYGLDVMLGTGPWGLVIFLLLGFGAAVFNVMRSAGLMAPSNLSIAALQDAEEKERRS